VASLRPRGFESHPLRQENLVSNDPSTYGSARAKIFNMYLTITPYTEKLASGKFTGNFNIFEHDGPHIKHTPYYLKEHFISEEDAFRAAEASALRNIHNNYSKGTKYIIDKKKHT